MAKGRRASTILSLGAVIMSFTALMLAIWCFTNGRVALGVYNLAIVAISMLTFIVVWAKVVGAKHDDH